MRSWAAIAVLFLLPFAANIGLASAASMEHMGGDAHATCASYCARLSFSPPPQAIVQDNEIKTPDPKATPPCLSFYIEFQKINLGLVPQPNPGRNGFVIRPPDIVALTTNFRI
jgi:hypothetical protein